jgi:UDP-4-amino-4-deoxy-L-arabinose formyltransferase/UDP-glucuronic acid dehydrogenase (UDP-4-keto-hexauronic acid decarboxylating)
VRQADARPRHLGLRPRGLRFTLFRPFNWIGPELDSIEATKEGSSRVVTQFVADLYLGRDISLVDGGAQRRCFTWVDDGIDALMRIIANHDGCCDGGIFNIGAPDNECSIKELAEQLLDLYRRHPSANQTCPSRIVTTPSATFYGAGYQDILSRKPNIERARRLLGWEPKVTLSDALKLTLDAFIAAQQKAG